MYGWITEAVRTFVDSPWLFVLVFGVLLGGAFLPGLPGGTVLMTATAAAAASSDPAPRVAFVYLSAIAGAFVGDVIGYTIGRRYGTRLLAHRCLRRARRPVLRARSLMRRHRTTILIAARFLPGGRLSSVLAAGIARVGMPRFLAVAVPVAAVWGVWMTVLGLVGSAVAGRSVIGGPVAAMLISALVTTIGAGIGAWRARSRLRAGREDAPIAAREPAGQGTQPVSSAQR